MCGKVTPYRPLDEIPHEACSMVLGSIFASISQRIGVSSLKFCSEAGIFA